MDLKKLRSINALAYNEKWEEAANEALALIGRPPTAVGKKASVAILRKLLQHLLDNDKYMEAATLQFGGDMFNAGPESVQRTFKAIEESSKVLLMGASSMGKSYSGGVWMALDYLRDPLYTTIKLAAVNEDHLKKNLFAHLAKLFRNLAIPSEHEIIVRDADLWIGIKEAGYEFGISGIAFKQSQERGGQFKGYKSLPVRKVPHPKFGMMSRIRVLLDEGQDAPGGPFQDFNSLYASISGLGRVKVVVAFNPVSVDRIVCQMAEPEGGYHLDQIDTLYDWTSRAGWRVCRLDAALSENVRQKKMIYEGLQTYDGYMGYLKAGGDTSSSYMCFARGFPPMKGSNNNIIPPMWPHEARGEATFIERPVLVAAVDLAFMGEDTAQMAVGRWGLASGYKTEHAILGPDGVPNNFVNFHDRTDLKRNRPRHVLQIDQLIPLSKHDDTILMAQEIIGRCKRLGIAPENVGVDKTAIGQGTYDHLKSAWGDVIGVMWSEGASDMKILAEDQAPASAQCDGIPSEMWWTFRRWIDPTVRAILINPIIHPQPLNTQFTSRQYDTGKKGIKVESKEKYKARNQKSPDEADSVIMLTYVVRKITDTLPGMVERPVSTPERQTADVVVQTPAKQQPTEDDDAVGQEGDEDKDFDHAQAED